MVPLNSHLRIQIAAAKVQHPGPYNKTLCIGINSVYRPRGPYVHLLVSGLLQHIPGMIIKERSDERMSYFAVILRYGRMAIGVI